MKKRLDVLMVEQGVAQTRQKAQALILTGSVRVNGVAAQKSSMQVDDTAHISVQEPLRFVSRGGLKLEKALQVFDLCIDDAVCADVGASTGGFTDCMLQANAAKVYAIDVGYGQLDWKLRNDARVVVMERTNARFIKPEDFEEAFDFVGVDASFISLKLLLAPIYACMQPHARAVMLIKPQFEAGKGLVGKNGVVRDAGVHMQVIDDVIAFARNTGFGVTGLSYSPITGPKGNIEFLLLLDRCADHQTQIDVEAVVHAAHQAHKM